MIEAARTPFIECSQLNLSFDLGRTQQKVLNGLDLQVLDGQIVSLLGPSGCGKSTLLRVVAGLIQADTGTTSIDGLELRGNMPRNVRDQLSFVFQEPALLPWRTVLQNVLLPSELRGTKRKPETLARIEHLLGLVGFQTSDWNKLPSQLSGGMKMRASIARAMSTQPKLLLLDEPFAALDDMLRSKLNDLLLTISAEENCTMLFVTHNISEAIYLSHEIAIMSHGQISQKLSVPLSFPRYAKMRSSFEFAEFYGHVLETLTACNS